MVPRVLIRVDASILIGTGHVMRCLTLARALAEEGAEVCFVSRDHPGNLNAYIEASGFPVLEISGDGVGGGAFPGDSPHAHWLGGSWEADARQTARHAAARRADLLIVDHYALDARWEAEVGVLPERIVVIDDLADRPHGCALLVDANLGRRARDYAGLVPSGAIVLAGAEYALLRAEFAAAREKSLARRRDPALRRILVAMGGVDMPNATGRVLDAFDASVLPDACQITIVLGSRAPWLDEVRSAAVKQRRPTEVLIDVTDMAELMADSDLAVGGAGVTAWERGCLGLPTLIVTIADNQLAGAKALADTGAARWVGGVEDVATRLAGLIEEVAEPRTLAAMSQAASAITDGEGIRRVVAHIGRLCQAVDRPATG